MRLLSTLVAPAHHSCQRALFAFAVLLLSGCSGGRPLPSGIDRQALRDIAPAEDLDPAPGVVEVRLRASQVEYKFFDGGMSEVLAYNGQVPGPLIEARAGDRVIVRFQNDLSQPSTIHWHGIRLSPGMDGSPLSQDPVPPGGSFTYDFIVPDAGLYWYHPHHNEEEQIQSGLYGPLLVRGTNEPAFTRERVIVLSDIMLDRMGMPMPMDNSTDDPYMQALGMEGNVLLLNGQRMPVIELRPGCRERWRIVNSAGARYFKLALPGHAMTLVGVDGGLIEAPVAIGSMLLAPGERADLVVDSGTAGQGAGVLLNQSYARLADTVFTPPADTELAIVLTKGAPVDSPPPIPAHLRTIEVPDTPHPQRSITLNAALDPPLPDPPLLASAMEDGGMGGGGNGEGAARFMINGAIWPEVPAFEVRRGEAEVWEIYNHTQMDHPFHIHGFHFQVLDLNGEPWPWRGWKDTVNVPAGNGGENRLHILVQYEGEPGDWLYHCHILHHNAMGMMAAFTVNP